MSFLTLVEPLVQRLRLTIDGPLSHGDRGQRQLDSIASGAADFFSKKIIPKLPTDTSSDDLLSCVLAALWVEGALKSQGQYSHDDSCDEDSDDELAVQKMILHRAQARPLLTNSFDVSILVKNLENFLESVNAVTTLTADDCGDDVDLFETVSNDDLKRVVAFVKQGTSLERFVQTAAELLGVTLTSAAVVSRLGVLIGAEAPDEPAKGAQQPTAVVAALS